MASHKGRSSVLFISVSPGHTAPFPAVLTRMASLLRSGKCRQDALYRTGRPLQDSWSSLPSPQVGEAMEGKRPLRIIVCEQQRGMDTLCPVPQRCSGGCPQLGSHPSAVLPFKLPLGFSPLLLPGHGSITQEPQMQNGSREDSHLPPPLSSLRDGWGPEIRH